MIYPEINSETELKPKECVPGKAPKDFSPSKFFTENIRGFLPPYYSDEANEISKECHFDFVKEWAFEADQLIAQLGVEEKLGSTVDYMGGQHRDPIYSFSSTLTEIYKSTFTRVLREFHKSGRLEDWKYYQLFDKTIPIDPSFWEVAPQKSPTWWPQNTAESVYSDYARELVTFSVDGQLEKLPTSGDQVVIGLDGAVKPREGWVTGLSRTRVCLLSFLYNVEGPKIPKAEEIFSELEYRLHYIVPSSGSEKTIQYLAADTHLAVDSKPIEMEDLTIYPLVGRVHQNVINIWQWWRGYHHAFTPHKFLGGCKGVKVAPDHWEYIDKMHVPFCKSVEWIEGMSERAPQSSETQHGTYITVKKDFLDLLVNESKLRLAHIVQFSHRAGSNRREERKIAKETYLHNFSPLIL